MERESENVNRTETLATQAKGPMASETPYLGGLGEGGGGVEEGVTNDENETFFAGLVLISERQTSEANKILGSAKSFPTHHTTNP